MNINLNSKQIQITNVKCYKELSKVLNLKNWNFDIVSNFVFRNSILGLLISAVLISINLFYPGSIYAQYNYWSVQSIDTVKYSRDLAREGMSNPLFDSVIKSQIQEIAETGATHVALGTPYDEEFIPYLQRWVKAARENNLKVWFRGNFAGWEGWFDYPSISKDDHLKKTEEFIQNNPPLFEDGDIFTPCTECENGQLGDPRQTGEVDEFRQFLIKEYEISKDAFFKLAKNVSTGYFSMNGDVAYLVMDEETTDKLGNLVVIDHYVNDPQQLAEDVKEISEKSGGKVVLGEFGAPIPDIHGDMNAKMQSEWIETALVNLTKEESLEGVNYWVSLGGSTAIWNNDFTEKPAVTILKDYFSPSQLSGIVVNELDKPIEDVLVVADAKQTYTDEEGKFEIVTNPSLQRIVLSAHTYKEHEIEYIQGEDFGEIVLEKESESIIFKFRKFISKVITKVGDLFN